jgi:hypothetical protein
VEEEHVVPIREDENSIFQNQDRSDDDASAEVTSTTLMNVKMNYYVYQHIFN